MSAPLELFRRLTSGLFVITATHGGRSGGFTAAWVSQVSFDPLLVILSVHPGHATWPLMEQSRRFAINVLKTGQHDLARHFGTSSGRDVEKFSTIRITPAGGPIVLADAAAWLDCRLERQHGAGDHMVVIARVAGGQVLDPDATPMQYAETGDMDGSAGLFPLDW